MLFRLEDGYIESPSSLRERARSSFFFVSLASITAHQTLFTASVPALYDAV